MTIMLLVPKLEPTGLGYTPPFGLLVGLAKLPFSRLTSYFLPLDDR